MPNSQLVQLKVQGRCCRDNNVQCINLNLVRSVQIWESQSKLRKWNEEKELWLDLPLSESVWVASKPPKKRGNKIVTSILTSFSHRSQDLVIMLLLIFFHMIKANQASLCFIKSVKMSLMEILPTCSSYFWSLSWALYLGCRWGSRRMSRASDLGGTVVDPWF